MRTNKEIVLELYAAFDRGDFELGKSMLSEDFITDLVGIPERLDRSAFIKFGSEFRHAFPDGYHQFEHVITEDDREKRGLN